MLAVLDRKHPGKIARDEQLRISVMALLHDVGHGPFSHAFEKVTDTDHEDWTRHIILDDTTEVNAVLRAHDAALPAVIAILFDKTSGADAFQGSMRALVDIVSSQLDADRMDYLLRDSMMTGSRLGQIDMSWLVRCVDIDFEKQTLFLSHKGLQAAESNILARHHMFKSVYFHKTTRSAEVMLKSVLEAITLKLRNGADWQTLIPGTGPHLLPAMLGRLDMQSYLRMDDVSVWELLKCCGDSRIRRSAILAMDS
ncbi:MAG: HD domain-containing protein [bacterium]